MVNFYKWSILCSLLYTLCYIRTCSTDKESDYTSNDIEPQRHEKKPFNLGKYNDIWLLALTKLEEEKLLTLRKILKKLDRTELDIKHSEKDDTLVRQTVQEHLNQVLKDYGLFDEQILDHHNIKFNEERLNKIWQDAIGPDGHYTKEELRNLYTEIRHMEEKIRKFENDKAKEHDSKNIENDARIANNHVPLTDDEDNVQEQNLDKDKDRLDDHITLLEEKSKTKMEKAGFSDNRVVHLWKSVKNSGNFSSDEIEIIKNELSHFQTQIDKLRHWEKHSETLQKHGSQEGNDDISHEYLQTQDKIKEYRRKVKKYHATMAKRVSMKTEL